MKKFLLILFAGMICMLAFGAKNGYFKKNSDATIDIVATEAELVTVTVSGNATIAGTLDVTGDITGDLTMTKTKLVPAFLGKAGAGAGWVVTGIDKGFCTLPASKTDDTLVIPIDDLNIGDSISRFTFKAQAESAGNTNTIVFSIHKSTLAATGTIDSVVGTTSIQTNFADKAVTAVIALIAGPEVIASGESLYALITATTAASTDFEMIGIEYQVEENP